MVKKYILFVISLLLFSSITIAQDTEYKSNSIYANYGTVIFAHQVSVSYERLLFQKNKMRTKAKLNYGNWVSDGLDYDIDAKATQSYLSLSGVQLFGMFEIGAGAALRRYQYGNGINLTPGDPPADYWDIKSDVVFYGNIGLRYEEGGFLFRAGIGNLELLYLGLGVNF